MQRCTTGSILEKEIGKKVIVRESERKKGEWGKRKVWGWGWGFSVFCFVISCMPYTSRFFYL